MGNKPDFKSLLEEVRKTLESAQERDEKLASICDLLKNRVSYYNWVGFYLVNPNQEQELMLGPFAGEPTEHVQIAFGQGICGQAAALEQTFIIQDVSKETNYLSCSPDVQSEIVIPLFKDGAVVGELDIDSHKLSPFTGEDRAFLEQVAQEIAELF